MHSVTKQFRDFPAAHRQPNHDGHCRLIHGHNWSFDITFQCRQMDENGFVIDVGKLQGIRDWLAQYFDHTLLLNKDDPFRGFLEEALGKEGAGQTEEGTQLPYFASIVIVPNCGMEGLAAYIYEELNCLCCLREDLFKRGVKISRVTVWEDSKNSATYE